MILWLMGKGKRQGEHMPNLVNAKTSFQLTFHWPELGHVATAAVEAENCSPYLGSHVSS